MPIRTSRAQNFIPTRNANLAFVRPHIVRIGNPAGSLKVQLQTELGFLLQETNLVAINTIGLNGVATLDFAHGYTRFTAPFPVAKDIEYRIALVGSGYTYSDAAHVGFVIANPDFSKVTQNYSGSNPLDFELWELNPMTREIDFFDGFETSSAPTQGTQVPILNGQGAPLDITGMVFDSSQTHKARIGYTIYRRTDSAENREEGVIELQFKPDAAVWSTTLEIDKNYDVSGVTLSVVAGTAQFQYISDTLAGANYDGYIIFEEIMIFPVGT